MLRREKTTPVNLFDQLFQCEANVIPQPEQDILRIQLLGLANYVMDRTLLPLVGEFNVTTTKYSGIDLMLYYENSPEKPLE